MSKFILNLLVQFSKVLPNSKIKWNLKRISFWILARLRIGPSRGPPLLPPRPAHSHFPSHWATAATHHWAPAFGSPSQPARPTLSHWRVGPARSSSSMGRMPDAASRASVRTASRLPLFCSWNDWSNPPPHHSPPPPWLIPSWNGRLHNHHGAPPSPPVLLRRPAALSPSNPIKGCPGIPSSHHFSLAPPCPNSKPWATLHRSSPRLCLHHRRSATSSPLDLRWGSKWVPHTPSSSPAPWPAPLCTGAAGGRAPMRLMSPYRVSPPWIETERGPCSVDGVHSFFFTKIILKSIIPGCFVKKPLGFSKFNLQSMISQLDPWFLKNNS
jgi:hypothetical protein